MKKILVLNASQSKRAVTRRLLDFAIEKIASHGSMVQTSFADAVDGQWNYEDVGEADYSVLYFDLKKLTYKGCIDCGFCSKHRRCMLKDDIKWMYRYFDEADYVITASPIYFGGTPSKFKALIDRMQAVFHSKYTLMDSLISRDKNRFAINILTGGEPVSETQFAGIKGELKYFYKSINTEELQDILLSDTDRVDPNEEQDVLAQIEFAIEELLRQETTA